MSAVKHWFERLPIGGKLTVLASVVSGLALLISGLLLTIADYLERVEKRNAYRIKQANYE